MGNGSGFDSFEQYVDVADEVLDSMCGCELKNTLAIVALIAPGVFQEALSRLAGSPAERAEHNKA